MSSAAFTLHYFWHPHALFPPDADCDGSTTQTLPASVIVGASTPPTANFFAWAQLPNGWEQSEAIKADCNGWTPPTTQVDDEFPGSNGTTLDPFVPTLSIEFNRRGGPGLRAPVAALVRGNGFTLTTGLHLSEETTCQGSCSGTLKKEERYSIKFTPRR